MSSKKWDLSKKKNYIHIDTPVFTFTVNDLDPTTVTYSK